MKILIAEDDDEMRGLIEALLTASGYEVCARADGRQAWESLQADGADMAVIDMNMPKMDGLELVDRIRADERFKEMPVLFLTAEHSVRPRHMVLIDGYLTKPFKNDVLVARVKALEQALSA